MGSEAWKGPGEATQRAALLRAVHGILITPARAHSSTQQEHSPLAVALYHGQKSKGLKRIEKKQGYRDNLLSGQPKHALPNAS